MVKPLKGTNIMAISEYHQVLGPTTGEGLLISNRYGLPSLGSSSSLWYSDGRGPVQITVEVWISGGIMKSNIDELHIIR